MGTGSDDTEKPPRACFSHNTRTHADIQRLEGGRGQGIPICHQVITHSAI